MLIRDIIVEGYAESLVELVQDVLVMYMKQGAEEIPMDEFRAKLSKHGYNASAEEIIAAVDASGMASQVDRTRIVPTSELPDDLAGDEEEMGADVGAMAGDQAMADINSELPQ